MPRGGARPGAGRPRKPVVVLPGAPVEQVPAVSVVRDEQVTPLEYMIAVMNDPGADDARRDRMAQAAAPYVHPKADGEGKKAQRQTAARTAERGTDWESLLGPRN